MKLKQEVLTLINNKRTRALLSIALGKTESSILRYIANNDDSLTKAAALQVIRKETGLSNSEILETEDAAA